MNEKDSPDIFSKEDFAYLTTLNEGQKRHYKASVAIHQKAAGQSIRKISKKWERAKTQPTGVSRNSRILSRATPGVYGKKEVAGIVFCHNIRSGLKRSSL